MAVEDQDMVKFWKCVVVKQLRAKYFGPITPHRTSHHIGRWTEYCFVASGKEVHQRLCHHQISAQKQGEEAGGGPQTTTKIRVRQPA